MDISCDEALASHCRAVRVSVPGTCFGGTVPFWKAKPVIHVYRLSADVGVEQMGEDGGDAENATVACHQFMLPFVDFEGLWDSLYFDTNIKDQLIKYAMTALLFSSRHVDPAIITCNRVVLLHGPPGTGKTTLCKALAQTLSVRLQSRYTSTQLVEINSHSLFSKWFSESGKLVQRLFERIEELVSDKQSLVFVLIDEVESLASARQSAMSGSEPSDAVRSVNALLTQIDRLQRFENVMVLATSNITEAIDVAFLDRADIRQYIGPPSLRARYEILRTCLNELARVGLVQLTMTMMTAVGDKEDDGASAGANANVDMNAMDRGSTSNTSANTTTTSSSSSSSSSTAPHRKNALLPYDALAREYAGIVTRLESAETPVSPSSPFTTTSSGLKSGGLESKSNLRTATTTTTTTATSSLSSIQAEGQPPFESLLPSPAPSQLSTRSHPHYASLGLLRIAYCAAGLSGRGLRKLPFQAHATGLSSEVEWVADDDGMAEAATAAVPLDAYYVALETAIKKRLGE